MTNKTVTVTSNCLYQVLLQQNTVWVATVYTAWTSTHSSAATDDTQTRLNKHARRLITLHYIALHYIVDFYRGLSKNRKPQVTTN